MSKKKGETSEEGTYWNIYLDKTDWSKEGTDEVLNWIRNRVLVGMDRPEREMFLIDKGAYLRVDMLCSSPEERK